MMTMSHEYWILGTVVPWRHHFVTNLCLIARNFIKFDFKKGPFSHYFSANEYDEQLAKHGHEHVLPLENMRKPKKNFNLIV